MIFQARSSGGNFQAGDDFLFGFRQGVRQGDFSGQEWGDSGGMTPGWHSRGPWVLSDPKNTCSIIKKMSQGKKH